MPGSSVGAIVARLEATLASLDTSTTLLRRVRDLTSEFVDQVSAMGLYDKAAHGMHLHERLNDVDADLTAALDRIRQLIHTAQALTGSPTAGGAPAVTPAASNPSSPSVSSGTPNPVQEPSGDELEALTGRERPPKWVTEGGAGLPQRPGGRGPTHGKVYDATGRDLTPDGVASGVDKSLIEDLVLDGRERLALPLLSHVEAKVAADIRRGNLPADSVLILDNWPCSGKYGCDEYLPSILPAGTRLAVYVSDGQHTSHLKTYRGTGRRIAL